jgi:carbonic anhydrase
MTVRSLLFGTLLLSNTISCKERAPQETHERKTVGNHAQETKHWSYEGETGPEHWAELEKNDCGGSMQSPIDILDPQAEGALPPLDIHYRVETKIHDIVNNGHTVQFNFDPGDYLVINGVQYMLKQFHFHEAAEHTIKGVRYPLEIHLVHKSEHGDYAVLSVMAEESTTNSKAFDFLENYLPLPAGTTRAVKASFDMSEALPRAKQYYTYTGSLTTPPCTQGVQWFIFKRPVTVSFEMIQELRKNLPVNNYRNVQQINGRIVKESLQ